jgi:hypothetical protein
MCRNLDLRFLLFYCILSKFFSRPFSLFFGLAFYCLFSFCRIGFCFYRPSFSLFFFDIVLFLFLWLVWFHLYSLAYPNLLGTKRLGCCCFSFIFWLYFLVLFISKSKLYAYHIHIKLFGPFIVLSG